ncbi:hypothetical protein OZG88_23440, partial [Escherichia coli]|nr:hypothetical protein [Escherichia coli]
RARFHSVSDHADRWEAPVYCFTDKADIMPACRKMFGQGSKLTQAAPVHESHMHVSPFQTSEHELTGAQMP